ncbi:MAG: M50 family metallopeptidase [Verrucomicrobiae bacterium]|nr:M50 family metallopeptidase [Verrucomicrobiae bacterium]
MNQSFYNWGLPLGTLFGIRVRLHFLLLIFLAFQLSTFLKDYDPRTGFTIWAIFSVLLFLIIYFHELGHCFAARRVGGSAEDVLLWPLGGLAFTRYPQTWRNTLIVVAGGPLVNVAIAILAVPIFYLADRSNPDLQYNLYYFCFREVLFRWNLIMLVFNLIPLFPLDGGQLLRAGLWGWFQKKGGIGDGPYYHASRLTVPVSMTIGGIGAAIFLYRWLQGDRDALMAVGIFAWAMINTWQLKKQLENMSSMTIDQGSEFGYDFSEGYTSLAKGPGGDSAPSVKRANKAAARREEKQRKSAEDDEQRMDALFKKINDQGLQSLTNAERKFLEDMSKRMQ